MRPPMSPHIPVELDDIVPTGFQSRAIEIVEEHGGAYVDLRHLRMSARMFRNEDHMNAEGSARFTRALAEIVRERGWLTPAGGLPPWPGAEKEAITLATPSPASMVPSAGLLPLQRARRGSPSR